ncbi:gamma carbonic dehydratase [Trypanosoma theileri]|uniref:Gamma carbonic dehydratase n=1 Tax=Trypanosoma theileri TaxID=67003 RepID=A0A1X0NNY9_9TRYP|nr:gamma carbonic dehydratase [Trypanosoma theileri]ORC86424.1 gamma carbonic dehydratase [Trypanosoma theileri]
MPPTVVYGAVPYLAYLIKDVGARLAIMGHYLQTSRHMYPVTRHQNIRAYRGLLPWTQDCGFIAPSAFVCGNVELGHDVCIFYHTVLRQYHTAADAVLVIMDGSVVMDRATLIGTVRVGAGSFIGIGASLDCCTVGDHTFIGHGATIALGANIENNAIVAPGACVPKDTIIHTGEVWAGNPARKVADVDSDYGIHLQHMLQRCRENGRAHVEALHTHMHRTEELDAEWLHHALAEMEKQQQQMILKTPVDIPLEAKRFLEPRVHMRRPEMHMRMSYPVNRVAPWMPKVADQTANA